VQRGLVFRGLTEQGLDPCQLKRQRHHRGQPIATNFCRRPGVADPATCHVVGAYDTKYGCTNTHSRAISGCLARGGQTRDGRRSEANTDSEQPRGPRPRAPQQRACPSAGLAATPTRGRAGLEAASSPQESAGTASDLPSE
jgi:hypothetical protein